MFCYWPTNSGLCFPPVFLRFRLVGLGGTGQPLEPSARSPLHRWGVALVLESIEILCTLCGKQSCKESFCVRERAVGVLRRSPSVWSCPSGKQPTVLSFFMASVSQVWSWEYILVVLSDCCSVACGCRDRLGRTISAAKVAFVCGLWSVGVVALLSASLSCYFCTHQLLFPCLEVLVQSASPHHAVGCKVLPGHGVDAKCFHVSLADILVAQMWAAFGSPSRCQLSIENVFWDAAIYQILGYIQVWCFAMLAYCRTHWFTTGCFTGGNPHRFYTLCCVHVSTGKKGNLTEQIVGVVISVLLSIPSLFGALFLLLWQSYVLRAEVVLSGIQIAFIGLELIFGIVSIITFAR